MRIYFLLAALVILQVFFPIGAMDKNVVLSFGGYDHPMAKTAERILREAYAAIGVRLELKLFPPERFQLMGDIGQVDGILFGGENIGDKYTNLVRIPTALGSDEIVVFTKQVSFKVNGWESLRPYRIGVMNGMPEIQKKTSGMNVELVPDPRQLFQKLEFERNDIVVFPKLFGKKILKELNITSIRILPGTVDRWGLYHYLNRKNNNLNAISEALSAMERRGQIKYYNHIMEEELSR